MIRKRKSVRKYDMTKLDEATLNKIREKIGALVPLFPEIRYSIEMTDSTKGLFNIKAPHYLVFGSEQAEGFAENIGFIGQQLDLFFSEIGLGACWLGAAKPQGEVNSALPFVICMSFGRPAEELHRNLADFRRKPLHEMSEGQDPRLEAARLAPSGINAQNWYFIAEGGKIHCYRKKAVLGFINKMGFIDLGIAIWHIASESENFAYTKEVNAPEKKGYIYMGTVK
ncbi:MAG: nitroreductase [Clostridiales bacterium]|jgi:nitroreductase|nr:nitroreductase [Clostridiales bacterium]